MLVSSDQNADQNRDITIGNRSFENVSQFKYLGTTVTNQNLIKEEIKMILNSGNACYQSIQNLLSSHLLRETWSLTLIRIIKFRRMRWVGHMAQIGGKRNWYRLLVGKPEGKRPLGRLRCRWTDNIKMDLLAIGLSVVDWIGLA
jgi:hypothetical protein